MTIIQWHHEACGITYYRDEINDDESENDANENMVSNNETTATKSFKNETKIIGSTSSNGNRINAAVLVPLKDLSKFWRSFHLLLINC